MNWNVSAGAADAYINGYVVMPEHVQFLISEPQHAKLSTVMQMIKQITSRKMGLREWPSFSQVRYHDFPARIVARPRRLELEQL